LSATLGQLDAGRMRLGLEPTRALLDALGAPDRRFPIILVAGTNGKGSVSATLASIATCSGRRCGLFTSPHLEEPRERIRIDGEAITEDRLEHLVAETVRVAAGLGDEPTYFEATTCAALLAFADAGVDLAILEVGLGGRLDATNATEPVLSVITTIALDHQEYLGDSLAAIAREKAGIMRRDRRTVVAGSSFEVRAALDDAAAAAGAMLEPARLPYGIVRERLTVHGERGTYVARGALVGAHQAANLRLATQAAEALIDLGLLGAQPRIADGLARVRWPGRLEHVPLDETVVIFDGAHNPAGVAALLDALGDAPYDLVFGVLGDKDVASMLPPLAARARKVVLTRPLHTARALPPESLATLIEEPASIAADPLAAIQQALAQPAPRIVVAGSLYLVGEARHALRRLRGVPAPAAEISTVAPPGRGPGR
jgi:dihydrofolate synthase/folylpolyglutamate synthase